MAGGLTQLQQWADGLLQQLAPAQRRALARDIARTLRTSHQRRIAAQQNPDGSAYAPRIRQRHGRIKQRANMFAKLRTARYFKLEAGADAASIGFAGRVARIAGVHQDGLRDRVRPGVDYQYPRRELLGYTDADVDQLQQLVLHHLAP